MDPRHRPRRHRDPEAGREARSRPRARSREELGREAFVERVWQWREEYGGQIIEQFKRLGATLDYDDERFTLDERYARAVLEVFVALYRKGLIYRDHYLVNWDPGTQSAISDLEVEDREETDTLFHIAYPLEDGSGEVVVATVRPETMLADTAVAVNPADERYAHLDRQDGDPAARRAARLPIIADDYVKTDFGTGALKITPGHDPNDFEIGRRHGLEEIQRHRRGRPHDRRPPASTPGLRVDEAQERVVAALRDAGPDPPHRALHAHRPVQPPLGRAHRAAHLAAVVHAHGRARRAGDRGRARRARPRSIPPSQSRRYVDWLENIRPVVHQPPAVVGPPDPGLVPRRRRSTSAPSRREGEGWERDPDVLDTWFSSALWPFATLGWPEETPELRAFYPTDVLSTARDILFLWVARMVMMGLEFTGEIPFADVYVHSVIQAPDGRRMSKSLGTGIDPLDEIDRHGADAVRFGLLAMSSTQDVRYSEREGRSRASAWRTSCSTPRGYVLLNVARGRDGRAAAADGLRPLDPVAAAGGEGRRSPTASTRFDFAKARARPLRLRLRRAVRLVPRVHQGPRVRRRSSRRRCSTCCARRSRSRTR